MSAPRRATVRLQLPPRSGLRSISPETIFDPRVRDALARYSQKASSQYGRIVSGADLPPPPEISNPELARTQQRWAAERYAGYAAESKASTIVEPALVPTSRPILGEAVTTDAKGRMVRVPVKPGEKLPERQPATRPPKQYTPEDVKTKPDVVLRRQLIRAGDGSVRPVPKGTRTLAVVAKEAVPPAGGDLPVSGTVKYSPALVSKPSSLPKWLGGKPTTQQMLSVEYIKSFEKGSAFTGFQKLIEISERAGRPIYSATLVPQLSDKSFSLRSKSPLLDVGKALGAKATTYDVLKKEYPQLRYREVPGLTTSGKFWANVYPPVSGEARVNEGSGPHAVGKNFRTMDELRSFVNRIPKESLYNPNTSFRIDGLISTTRPDMVQRALNVGYAAGPVAAETVPKLVRGALPIAAQVAAEDAIRYGLNQSPAAVGYAPTQSGSGTTADRLNRFASRVTAGAAVGGALGSVTGPGALATATTVAVMAGAYDLAETGVELGRKYYQNVELPVRERLNNRPNFTAQMYPNGYPGLPTNIR